MSHDPSQDPADSTPSGAVMSNDEFATMLSRARAGDGEATAAILQAFEADVRLMVRHRLPRVLRSQFDSMDFVQAVWQSVFAGGGTEAEFGGAGHFRGYLAGVARNKVFEEYRRRTTKKFDLGREEPLFVKKGRHDAPRQIASPDPSPSQVVQAEECWDRLIDGGSPQVAEILALRRDGLTFLEIASRTGIQERSVRRVIEELRKRMDGR